MLWLAVTSAPLSLSVPAVGKLLMINALKMLPSSVSLNPKSLAAKVLLPSSSTVIVASVPLGASLTAVMLVVIVLMLAEIAVVPPLVLVVTVTRASLVPVALYVPA